MASNLSLEQSVDKMFDDLVKSRFIEMFSSCKRVKLGNYIDQIRGVSYKPSDLGDLDENHIVLLRANNICDGKIDASEVYYIDKTKVNDDQLIQKGDILICGSSGSKEQVGKAAYCDNNQEKTFGAFCKVVRANGDLDSRYILEYFMSAEYRSIISHAVNGSNINNIRNEHIDNLLIPFPTYSQQKEFISFVEQVDKSKIIYKQLVSKYDDLVKSRFIEMFDNQNWSIATMESLLLPGAGLPYGIVQPGEEFENGIPIIRPVDILDGKANIDELKHTDPTISAAYKRTILTGSEVLITVRASIGRTMVTDERYTGMNVTRGIAVIRQDSNQIDPHYLNAFLNSTKAQDYFQSNAKGATIKDLNLGLLRKMNVIVPPMDLQKDFVMFAKQVEKSKIMILDLVRSLLLSKEVII